MAKVGYARVSSVGQSLDVQRDKLSGCDKLFEEKRSGTTDARPMLKQCLNYVREGDVLIVSRIDRLARSTLHLCQIAETLREKSVDLVVLDQNIDTSDATGRLLFNMLGAIGQFETEIRAERQMDGIKKAKDRGVQFGKRPALTATQIEELSKKRENGTLIRDLMAEYGLSKATIYRYLTPKDA
jgi:DNA invertase Pin-like site-specific DNA recombinase